MTKSLEANCRVEITSQYRNARDVNTVKDDLDWDVDDKGIPTKLFDGVGDTSVNRQWHDQIGLSSGNSHTHDIDVYGVIEDAFGDVLNLSNLKCVAVMNEAVSTGYGVSISGLVNGYAGPEGVYFSWNPHDGYDVTAGTDDTITLDSGSNDVQAEVIIIAEE